MKGSSARRASFSSPDCLANRCPAGRDTPDSLGKQRYRRAALSTVRTGRFVGVSRRLLTQQEAILARDDFRPVLSTIAVQPLIGVGVGDQDMVTPLERSMDIHKAVPGSELHVFRDCGHLPSIEKPDETIVLLRSWLDCS